MQFEIVREFDIPLDAVELARRILLEAWLRNALLYVTGLEAWRAAAPPLLDRLWLHLARTHSGGTT